MVNDNWTVEIAFMRGFGLCVNYTNEELEGVDIIADDLRHTIQIVLFIVVINISFFTHE